MTLMRGNVPGSQQRRIRELAPWFHNIRLDTGVQTAPYHPLGDYPACKWKTTSRCLPADMNGWRVLDIGCNAGYYSFAMAERGADVLGIDVDDHYLAQARWAASQRRLANPPRFERLSVYSIDTLGESFDLVWFMGVACNLRHPLLALDLIRTVTRSCLMFQMMSFPDRPPAVADDVPLHKRHAMVPDGAYGARAAQALLRSSGFAIVDSPEHETYWCRTRQVDSSVGLDLEEARPARLTTGGVTEAVASEPH